ncbi:hypothetical protein BOTBODRAFT_524644 [Botryobasidium botryosum FD-172 SS1]|uniref:Uncharacterized protein n=1 Tax=Botryobasidium botryosum (strain FD-172 SS1) TaxID=930990 RepID=A0A067M479_BOTB1|nr:hypothetical protein BOTBODRAFT_524644 [Botryobasidium botryosum FD-172 SS1]
MASSNQNTQNEAENAGSNPNETYELTVLRVRNVPKTHAFLPPKTFVTFTIGGQTFETGTRRGANPQWARAFAIQGNGSSMLNLEVRGVAGMCRVEFPVGTLSRPLEALWNMQRGAHAAGEAGFTCELQVTQPLSELVARPSIALQIQLPVLPEQPSQDLETADAFVAAAEQDLAAIRPTPRVIEAASAVEDRSQAIVDTSKDVLEPLGSLVGSIDAFVKIADTLAEIHPYVKVAWTIFSAVYKVAKAQQERDNALSELFEIMSATLAFARRADATTVINQKRSVVLEIAKKCNECALFVRNYAKTTGFVSRAIKNILATADNDISRFKLDFEVLHKNLSSEVMLSLAEMTKQGLSDIKVDLAAIRDGVKHVHHDVVLNNLHAIGSWDSDRVCLPDTRASVLDHVISWVYSTPDPGHNKPLFITGVAGSGKSSVANTLAQWSYDLGCLGSAFMFDRAHPQQNNSAALFGSVARQLARCDSAIAQSIISVLKDDPSLATAPPG